jgi:hypothetical protein
LGLSFEYPDGEIIEMLMDEHGLSRDDAQSTLDRARANS